MKLLSALLWSSLLATMAPSAWAQANTILAAAPAGEGQGTRTVMPDRFGLQLNIEETDMDADAARRRVQGNVARVLALFKQHKAVEGSVRADNLRIGPATRYEQNRQVFIGTRVSRQLRASFASVKAMQDVLGALKANENVQVSSLAPTYSGEAALRRELKGEAAAQTRQSAQGLPRPTARGCAACTAFPTWRRTSPTASRRAMAAVGRRRGPPAPEAPEQHRATGSRLPELGRSRPHHLHRKRVRHFPDKRRNLTML
jgi:uncharacterized protein YggE